MEVRLKLEEDIKAAMRAKEVAKLSTLRLMKAAIKTAEVAKMGELTHEEVLAILSREVKQRRETIPDFARGNRPDLVSKAEQEIAVITSYLPEPLSVDELDSLIRLAIAEVKASTSRDQGKVMAVIAPKVKGRADGKEVSTRVRALLEGIGGA